MARRTPRRNSPSTGRARASARWATYFYIARRRNNGIPIMKWISPGTAGHRCTREPASRDLSRPPLYVSISLYVSSSLSTPRPRSKFTCPPARGSSERGASGCGCTGGWVHAVPAAGLSHTRSRGVKRRLSCRGVSRREYSHSLTPKRRQLEPEQ